jgi:hypothetical protein
MAEASGGWSRRHVRPIDYFTGRKSDEARGPAHPRAKTGLQPGSRHDRGITRFKPVAELRASYGRLFPIGTRPSTFTAARVTQASQTYFVLHRLSATKT